MNANLEPQIIKTLDRLSFFSNKNNPLQMISLFYHSAVTLLKYANNEPNTLKKQNYFKQFYQMFELFSKADLSTLKKNHQNILQEIVEIIESETFIECLRPDLHNIRHLRSSLKRQKIEILEDDILETPKKLSFEKSQQSSSQFSSQKKTLIFQQGQTQNDKLWRSLKKSYQDHNLDQAYEKAMQYLSNLTSTQQIPKQKSQLIKNISDQYQTMTGYYKQLDKQGWILDKQQSGIKLEYKVDDVMGMIQIRILGEGDIPIQPFMAIISQIDLMSDYVPFCYDTKLMKTISRNQRIGHSKIYIPLLNDRETYFYAAGYDRMKTTKSLFFFSKTINQDKVYQKKYDYTVPPQNDKYVRLEYKFFLVEYIPLSQNRAKIRLASKIDMKLNLVPKFFVFKSARIFAFDYFKNILDRVKKFKGSKWEQRIKQNPQLYKFFHKKIDQMLLKK